MKHTIYFAVSFALFLVLRFQPVSGQNIHLIKANELYNRFAYAEAIPEFLAAVKKYPDNTDAKIKLAECYRLTGGSDKAEYWYLQVLNAKESKPIYKLYYAQALMNNKNYDLAKVWFKEYQQSNPGDRRAVFALKTIENLPVYFSDTADFATTKLSINSANSDFNPVLYNNGIVFTSSREINFSSQRKHEWTGQPFLTLYYAKGKANEFTDVETFAPNVQVRYNDGPICFNKAGDEMYITRNNIERGKVLKSTDQVVKLKIFHAIKENNVWKEDAGFQYNNDNYSCGHAALSPDGKYLFFASDMPGGFGGMDLYMCKKDTGAWSEPKNMGDKINTSGNELFPYLHEDGTFVFASNGRDGLGGLDVYWCKIKDGNISAEAKNLGAPINSSEDDFSVVFSNETHVGYYSSNRELKNANDDIYSFKRALKLKGIVVKKGTEIPVGDAQVTLKTKTSADLTITSNREGRFEFPIECGNEYEVVATKDGWTNDVARMNTIDYFPAENLYVKLQLEEKPVVKSYQLIVHVIDKITKKPINTAVIGLDQTETTLGYTNEKGIWQQPLKPNTTLHLVITKDGYQTKIIYMSNVGQEKEKDYEFIVELSKGEDIGPYARWYKIIYYDFDKSNVRDPDATQTLKEVAEFLTAHPDARLLMNSYCDSRGTTAYNLKLSKRRAEGATNWLVKNGIERKMVEKMEWGGESMLINKCSDGSLCSEEDHQLNRRTEIRVIRVERGITLKK